MGENGNKGSATGLPNREEMEKRLRQAGLGPKTNSKARRREQTPTLAASIYRVALGQGAIWADIEVHVGVIEIVVFGGDINRIRPAIEQLRPAEATALWHVRRPKGRQLRKLKWFMRLLRAQSIFQQFVRARIEEFGGQFRGTV